MFISPKTIVYDRYVDIVQDYTMFVDLQTKCLGGTTLFHNHKTKSEALKLSENHQVSAIPT